MRSLLGELWVRAAAVPEGTAVALGQAGGDAAQISLVPSGGQELGREGTHVRRVSPSPRPPSSAPFSRAGARGSWGGGGGAVTERAGLGHEGRCQAARRWSGAQAEGSRRPAPSLGSWEPSASLLTPAGALMSCPAWVCVSACASGSGHCARFLCLCVSAFCALEMCV